MWHGNLCHDLYKYFDRYCLYSAVYCEIGDYLEVKREYYQNCFIYCQRAASSMGTVNENSLHSPVGPWVCLFMFVRSNDLSLCLFMFYFTLDSWVISLYVVALA